MNIVYFSAHSILEYDDVRMFTEMGHDVFSIGAYEDPAHPGDDNVELGRPSKRPAIPGAKAHPELSALCHEVRHRHGAEGLDFMIDWAKADLHPEIIEWADVIICPFFPEAWIAYQWDRIKHKRVIWRTIGQSVESNERGMAPFRSQGLQIVRYSPKERNIPGFAGEDALIRFYKDPDEWQGWTGEDEVVTNFTQNLAQREPWTNYGFWQEATKGLPVKPSGPGSEAIGGTGEVPYEEMRSLLRSARCYLYTGTQPASYTLGLIEAMMTGIPVVSIPWHNMTIFPYGPRLFEGPEITQMSGHDADDCRLWLKILLDSHDKAQMESERVRSRAIELFGKETISRQWAEFLGSPAIREDRRAPTLVTA